jgi:hypothetical protein
VRDWVAKRQKVGNRFFCLAKQFNWLNCLTCGEIRGFSVEVLMGLQCGFATDLKPILKSPCARLGDAV